MGFLMKFSGMYTPLITPFGADGAIDHEAYAAEIEHLITAGVQPSEKLCCSGS